MVFNAIVADAAVHMGVGIAFSILDVITYKLAMPKAKRIHQKTTCLQGIDALLDAEKSETSVEKDSVSYAEDIRIVREYLRTSGLAKLELPWTGKIKDGFRNLIFHEKINGLSNMQKLFAGFGAEVLYDIVLEFQIHRVKAIATDLYQIPAFFVGLWLGNILRNIADIFIISAEENELDQTIRELIKETDIVRIVIDYAPSKKVSNDMAALGTRICLTKTGEKICQRLHQAAEDAMTYKQREEEKNAREKEKRQQRFDDLTKKR